MSNAIKFTAAGSVRVEVDLLATTLRTSMVRVRVIDTGIGMSPAGMQKLFLPFSQIHTGNLETYGGTGLGLSIARQLVELMHGQLMAESEEGVGSTFTFTMMLANSEGAPAREEAPCASLLLTGRRILVAEDSVVNQKVIETMLRRTGATPVVVNDGQQALDKLAHESFDMVFMDCQMPNVDGFAATAQLRHRESTQADRVRTPVIALTADALAESEHRCRAAGMDGFLTKPLVRKQLEHVLSTWLLPGGVQVANK